MEEKETNEEHEEFLNEEDIIHIIPLYDTTNNSSEVPDNACGVSGVEGTVD